MEPFRQEGLILIRVIELNQYPCCLESSNSPWSKSISAYAITKQRSQALRGYTSFLACAAISVTACYTSSNVSTALKLCQ